MQGREETTTVGETCYKHAEHGYTAFATQSYSSTIDENIEKATGQAIGLSHAAVKPEAIRKNDGSVLIDMDTVLTAEQWAAFQKGKKLEESGDRSKRNAMRDLRYRWPSNTVPYHFIRGTFSTSQKRMILGAMREWERYTCLKFRPARRSDRRGIYFMSGGGCSSNLGTIGNRKQPVSLAPLCRIHSIVLHELGHAIGMIHEQARSDRDSYINIHWQNIARGMRGQFTKFPTSTVNNYGIGYDYLSIMHYGPYGFSSNGQRTISTKDARYQNRIGRSKYLSFNDVKLANAMYQCASKCGRVSCPKGAFVDSSCKCQCPSSRYPSRTCGTVTPTKPTTKPSGSCVDKNKNCRVWAAKGFCTNPKYVNAMKVQCRKSCKICGSPVTVRPTPKPTPGGSCVDKNRNCRVWAAKRFCTAPKYRKSMMNLCRKSCKLCGGTVTKRPTPKPTPGSCVNKNRMCVVWAYQGYCHSFLHRRYMVNNCRRACHWCCANKSRMCPVWAGRGECTKNPKYMRPNCPRSCRLC